MIWTGCGKKNVWSLGDDETAYKVLDERGNFICYADRETGMAFVYDDYGRLIAYVAGVDGENSWYILYRSIKRSRGIYLYRKSSADDENGLPVYDKSGHLTMKEEKWTSDGSTNSKGEKKKAEAFMR